MRTIISKQLRARKRRLERRLDKRSFPAEPGPVLRAANIHYEVADRAVGTPYGGIGLMHRLVQQIGLAAAIDERLELLSFHLPYHESDHVLNLAYNALCDGTCLEDLELRRQDEAYLNVLGALRTPDPTTAGDFCRRFEQADLDALQDAFDVARRRVWARQPAAFFAQATIDVDGTLVGTDGECKQGMDLAYNGVWGYYPLVVSLANSGEVLRLVNRPGNRPSHEGAAAELDHSIALCRAAGFQKILLRGDTDFSQTQHLDRWHAQPGVQFLFGLDVTAPRHLDADELPESAWKPLERPPRQQVKTEPRARPANVKQQIVEERGYLDIRLVDEWVAEMPYRPHACQHTYRLIVLRKNLEVREPRQQRFFDDYRYFLYLTNDWKSAPAALVHEANERGNQENLLAQLKGGVRALRAPVDNLVCLAVTGLAFVGVPSSGAYVIRERAMRIHPGVAQAEVLRIMSNLHKTETGDSWVVGNHSLTVFYELDAEGRTYADPACPRVAGVFVAGPRPKTLLDQTLEFLGYRELSEIKSYC